MAPEPGEAEVKVDPWASLTGGVQAKEQRKGEKGTRRMPRLSVAKKDATSCEKRRGAANTH